MPSLLVAFEGMEASGKSTVARMVVKKLGGRWRLTGEPFSPALATLLREALAGYRRELAWSQTAQLYLFAADRFLHVYGVLVAGSLGRVWEEQCYFFEESIALSWLQGFNIITDRYKYSTIVYQGLLPHHPAVRHVWAERGPGPAALRILVGGNDN
jgi:thymidylate kinase